MTKVALKKEKCMNIYLAAVSVLSVGAHLGVGKVTVLKQGRIVHRSGLKNKIVKEWK